MRELRLFSKLPHRWPRGGLVASGAAYEQLLTPVMRARDTCSNNHPWRPETTRWRKRDRGGRHGWAVERDCLICKAVSSGYQMKRELRERSYR